MKSKPKITEIFSKNPPVDLKRQFNDYACVAIILNLSLPDWSVAYIRRAHNPKDPWSGQMAFPGGRRDQADSHDVDTAVRETYEEVGWQLTPAHHIGFLTDVRAQNRTGPLNFFLRPVVFSIENSFASTRLDPLEVDEVFWISIANLSNHKNQTTIHIPDRQLSLPGTNLPSGDILWGLSHIITRELIAKLECP